MKLNRLFSNTFPKYEFLSLDTFQRYNLILESRDSDNIFTATTTVVIEVTDENDNAPRFGQAEYVIDNRVVEEDHTITPENPMFLIRVRKYTVILYLLRFDLNSA